MAFDPSTAVLAEDEDKKKTFDPSTAVPIDEKPAEASLGQRIGQRLSEVPQRYEKAKETSGGGFLGPVNAAVGEGVRAAGDVVGEVGKTAATLIPEPVRKFASEKLGNIVLSAKEAPGIKQAVEGYQSLPESTKYNLGTGLGVAGLAANAIPAAKLGSEAIKFGMEAKTGLGNKILESGKSTLQAGMKPKDVTSRLAGKNVMEGAQNLIDRVDKYGLESPIGGFKGIAVKAGKRIDEEKNITDNLISDYAAKNPNATHDVDKSFINYIDDLQKGKIDDVFGDEEQAAKYASGIHKALELRNLAGEQPISKLPEIKQTIEKYGGGLFPKGSQAIGKDPLKLKTGELAYLRLKDDLESYVPEIADHNHAIHELIPVERAANEAVKRIGNKNKIGLEDWALLLGGPGAAHTLGASGLSGVAGIPGAVLMGKKALSSGRGSSMLMKTGKFIRGSEAEIKKPMVTLRSGETIPFPDWQKIRNSVMGPTLEEGNEIASKVGVKFNGIQEGIEGKIPDMYVFTDMGGTGSTIMATNIEDAMKKLMDMRGKFSQNE